MICSKCGEAHSLEEAELTFLRPEEVVKLSAEDRARQVAESSDLCIIEGKRFFIRALLPLLVKPQEYPYYIGLWVEVSQANFERVYQLWDSEDQICEPPFSAQIANEIPGMDGSLGLRAELRLTGPATRPKIFLQVSQHQLYFEQTHGIDAHRAYEYSTLFVQSTFSK